MKVPGFDQIMCYMFSSASNSGACSPALGQGVSAAKPRKKYTKRTCRGLILPGLQHPDAPFTAQLVLQNHRDWFDPRPLWAAPKNMMLEEWMVGDTVSLVTVPRGTCSKPILVLTAP